MPSRSPTNVDMELKVKRWRPPYGSRPKPCALSQRRVRKALLPIRQTFTRAVFSWQWYAMVMCLRPSWLQFGPAQLSVCKRQQSWLARSFAAAFERLPAWYGMGKPFGTAISLTDTQFSDVVSQTPSPWHRKSIPHTANECFRIARAVQPMACAGVEAVLQQNGGVDIQ